LHYEVGARGYDLSRVTITAIYNPCTADISPEFVIRFEEYKCPTIATIEDPIMISGELFANEDYNSTKNAQAFFDNYGALYEG
jgi:hypothetical protein